MLTVTEQATTQINKVTEADSFVRLRVDGGGCAGFSYTFVPESEKTAEDIQYGKLLVDEISHEVLDGSTVDYRSDLTGAFFTVNIPHATSSCGCGTSFNI